MNMSLDQNAFISRVWSKEVIYRKGAKMPLGGKKAPGVLLNLARRRVTKLPPTDPRRTSPSSCRGGSPDKVR